MFYPLSLASCIPTRRRSYLSSLAHNHNFSCGLLSVSLYLIHSSLDIDCTTIGSSPVSLFIICLLDPISPNLLSPIFILLEGLAFNRLFFFLSTYEVPSYLFRPLSPTSTPRCGQKRRLMKQKWGPRRLQLPFIGF